MDRIKKIIISFSLICLMNSCAYLLSHEFDWDNIQSVGGIKIEDPLLSFDGWYLPVKCDVSGSRTITNKPTGANSGLVCYNVKYSKTDSTILLTVLATVAQLDDSICESRAVNIGDLNRRKYKVYYKYEDKTYLIGEFDVSKIWKKY